jgi:hypothetical protein
VSRLCEWQIAKRLGAESYKPSTEIPEKPVLYAGYSCAAWVALWRSVIGAPMTPEIVTGECAVDLRSIGWKVRMEGYIKSEELVAPDPDRVERYDGIDMNNYPDEI